MNTRNYMKAYQIAAVMLGVLLCLTANAQDRQLVKETANVDPLPRDLEMQLALSARPCSYVYGLQAGIISQSRVLFAVVQTRGPGWAASRKQPAANRSVLLFSNPLSLAGDVAIL
jgi:hypothetical protein